MDILLMSFYLRRYIASVNYRLNEVSNITSTGKLTQNPLQNIAKGRASHYSALNSYYN